MKAIVVTDAAAGTAGMRLVGRPEPTPAINDVIVAVHASGFVPTEVAWPSTWSDRAGRDRAPSILGHPGAQQRALLRPTLSAAGALWLRSPVTRSSCGSARFSGQGTATRRSIY